MLLRDSQSELNKVDKGTKTRPTQKPRCSVSLAAFDNPSGGGGRGGLGGGAVEATPPPTAASQVQVLAEAMDEAGIGRTVAAAGAEVRRGGVAGGAVAGAG